MKILVLIPVLLMTEMVFAKCAPNNSAFIAEIKIDTCSTIDNESSLLISGKLKGYFEYGPEIQEPSVVNIEEWDVQASQNFVWKQDSSQSKDCTSFRIDDVIQVHMWYPCCDTRTGGGAVCQKSARWISDLPIGLRQDTHNKALNQDIGDADAS